MWPIIILFLLQSFLSLVQASSSLSCYVPELSPGTMICTIYGNRMNTSLSEEYFREVRIRVMEVDRFYRISEYPRPIDTLIVDIIGNVSIDDTGLKVLSSLAHLEVRNENSETSSIDIKPDVFKNMPNLKSIQFTGISLSNSTLLAIRQSPSVETLEIGNCGELSLKTGMFSGMKSVTSINIKFNDIISIENGAFEGLPRIFEIKLASNSIKNLPSKFTENSPSLKLVDLAVNEIGSIPAGTFQGASGLSILNLALNNIKSLNLGVFRGLKNLTNLKLGHTKLETIADHVFNDTPKLSSLNLNNNNLTRITPGTFAGLKNLEELLLARNAIASIEDNSFDGLINLRQLDLGGNPIRVLPDGLFQHNQELFRIWLEAGTCIENLSPANFTCPVGKISVSIVGNCQ